MLRCTAAEADSHIRFALTSLGHDPEGPEFSISARARRQILRKNRWAADLAFAIEPSEQGAEVLCTIEMLGAVKPAVLKEVEQELPDGLLLSSQVVIPLEASSILDEDIHGIGEAIERAGRQHLFFKPDEITHLDSQLRSGEHVLELGRGSYGLHFGIAVLTNQRLFFYRKAWVIGDSVNEFPISSITSIAFRESMSGDVLTVSTANVSDQLSNMNPGRGKAFADAFHSLRHDAEEPTRSAIEHEDLVTQLERLTVLREKGVLNDDEVNSAKTRLLNP